MKLTEASPRNYDGTSELLEVRVPKTAEVVADQIRKKIVRGELKSGDFLPPEGQMIASLSVSRPTLREALRVLEAERLISVVRGARTGARVHRPTVENAARYVGIVLQAERTTIHDIYEARLAIEPFAVRQLAKRGSGKSIKRLAAEVAVLKQLVDEGRYVDFMTGIAEFHHIIVELTGNRTLTFVTRMLQTIVARHQVEFLRSAGFTPEIQRKRALWGLRSFAKLIELIEAGDADLAEDHWRLHLTNASSSWVAHVTAEKVIDVL